MHKFGGLLLPVKKKSWGWGRGEAHENKWRMEVAELTRLFRTLGAKLS